MIKGSKSRNKSTGKINNVTVAAYEQLKQKTANFSNILQSGNILESPVSSSSSLNKLRMNSMPQQLYKFMRNASRGLLKKDSELKLQEAKNLEVEEPDSAVTCQSVISIKRRYDN